MECELCGKKTTKIFNVIIEGVILQVCEECSKFGKKIENNSKNKIIKSPIKKKEKIEPKEIREEEEIILPNAGEIIRKIREERNMNREEFAKMLNIKVKIIEKLENGEEGIDLEDVRKIEKKLKIKLTDKVVVNYDPKQKQLNEEEILTVGDIIKIK